MKRNLWLLGGVGLLGWALVVVDLEPAARAPSGPDALASLELAPPPHSGVKRSQDPAPPSSPVPVAPAPAAPPKAPSPEADPPPAQRLPPPSGYDPPQLRFLRALGKEPRDALWADDKEAKILALLAQGGAESLVDTVECRQRFCRIALTGRTSDDFSAFKRVLGMRGAMNAAPGPEPTVAFEDDQLIVYFLRKGYEVGDLPQ